MLELLIAISVLSVTLVAALSAFSTAYSNVNRSGEDTVAVTLAKQRYEWLQNQAFTSAVLSVGTTTETSISGYHGYSRTTLIQDNSPISGVKRVTVTVATPAGRSIQLISLRGK